MRGGRSFNIIIGHFAIRTVLEHRWQEQNRIMKKLKWKRLTISLWVKKTRLAGRTIEDCSKKIISALQIGLKMFVFELRVELSWKEIGDRF